MQRFKLFLLALFALAVPVALFAQAADPAPTPDSVGAAAITALVPVVVMVIVWGVRALAPSIPPILLPIIATSIGAASSFIGGLPTSGSAVRGAALGALAVFLREVLTTLGLDVSVRKVGVLFLACGVGLVGLQGCASTGGVKQGATTGLVASHAALALVQDTEIGLECGKPEAPPAPACVPSEVHKQIHAKLAVAFKLHRDAAAVVRAIPASITTPNQEVLNLVSQIWALVDEVIGMIPHSAPKAELQAVVSKLEVK